MADGTAVPPLAATAGGEGEEAMYTEHEVPEGEMDDLAGLTNLNEATLLHEIQVRYAANTIYTYVSDILVAVNPFKDLGLYGPETAELYRRIQKSEQKPHLFAVADACFHNLFTSRKNQCAVISGESGAGKTVSAKHVIKHILDLSHAKHAGSDRSLEDRIIQVGPMLEAFGNAQTTMNDNSSRFGKYTRLLFDIEGSAMGVQISEYLLEKSRVVEQPANERNFHVFYYLLACAEAESTYKLAAGRKHNAMSGQPWDDNGAMYKEFVDSMEAVGFSAEEQGSIHAILAGILHLTDVELEGDDRANLTAPAVGVAKTAAELLRLDPAVLQQALLVNHTVTRGEHIDRPYSREQAYDTRDAAAKSLYSRLFAWVVTKVNAVLAPGLHAPQNARPGVLARASKPSYEVGVLDIFGFENFENNSFEQLCINVAHEQLQFFFNQHTFRLELEEYEKEGIDGVQRISFTDNMPLLSMFLGRGISLLGLLDEECTFPKATDQSFVEKIDASFGDNPFYQVILKSRGHPAFAVKHFPGVVEYNGTNFLEKNRDNLAPDVVSVLRASAEPLVSAIFQGELTETGQLAVAAAGETRLHRGVAVGPTATGNTANRKAPSLGAQFKNSLNELVARMTACEPHFVRCIKPNLAQEPDNFDAAFVKVQLGYTGVLEATRIRQEGYSWRPTFDEFVRRFKIIAFPVTKLKRVVAGAKAARKIVEAAGISPVLVGRTKLFLKWHHLEAMERRLKGFYADVVRVQSAARAFFAMKVYRRKKERALMSQQEREAAEAAEAAENKRQAEAAATRQREAAEAHAAEMARQAELARLEQAKAEAQAREAEEQRRALELEAATADAEARRAEAEMKRLQDLHVAEEAAKAKAAADAAMGEATVIQEQALSEAMEAREAEMKARREAEELRQQVEAAEAEKEMVKKQRQLSVMNRKQRAAAADRDAAEKNRKVAELEKLLADARAEAAKANSQATGLQKVMEEEEEKAQQEQARMAEIKGIANLDSPAFDMRTWLAHKVGADWQVEGVEVTEKQVSGHVFKTGQRSKAWKKRWYVLDVEKGTVAYYDGPKSKKANGEVTGAAITRVFAPRKTKQVQHGWMIETEERTFFCKGVNQEQADLWVAAVSVFVQHHQS